MRSTRRDFYINSSYHDYGLRVEFMNCPTEIFNKLWAVRGSGTDDQECVTFAYDALGEMEYTGLYYLNLDEVTDETLSDWNLLHCWIENLGFNLWLEDIFINNSENLYSEDILPSDILKKPADLNVLILNAIKSKIISLELSLVSIGCTEICFDERTLLLLYHDSDAWSLGHENYIDVAEDLDSLSEAKGYYLL